MTKENTTKENVTTEKYKYRYKAYQDQTIAGVDMRAGDTGFLISDFPINRVGFELVGSKKKAPTSTSTTSTTPSTSTSTQKGKEVDENEQQ